MKAEENKHIVEEPSYSYGGKYSYADYLKWDMEEMVEIIKGKLYKWTAAPNRIHQKVATNLVTIINVFLFDKNCEVYSAPFDVRLPFKSKKDEDIFTVVQPDITVICDKSKLDYAGCIGAPDLIVEILSPSNNKKELRHKYEVYLESGVREYWVLQPVGQTLLIYTLKDGEYIPSKLYCPGDVVKSEVLIGFELDLEKFFKEIET